MRRTENLELLAHRLQREHREKRRSFTHKQQYEVGAREGERVKQYEVGKGVRG